MKQDGATLEAARAAKSKALERLSGIAGVSGVGISRVGRGYGVKVNLAARPAPDIELPDEIDGVPVIVEIVGPVTKRQS